jgi:hypothetical protein
MKEKKSAHKYKEVIELYFTCFHLNARLFTQELRTIKYPLEKNKLQTVFWTYCHYKNTFLKK